MDVKIERGLPQQPQQQKKNAVSAGGASFAEGLKAAAADRTDKTADDVFARAFSDRDNPDLHRLDAFLEGLIDKEMKRGGGL